MRKQDGFTLVELMVTMVVFVLVIASASSIFTAVLTQFKQQSKIAETNIEGIVGLELLRADIEQAGYGLPWDLDGINYLEAVAPANVYNDAANNPPRPVVFDDNNGVNISDIIIIKASTLAINDQSQKWAYITNTGLNTVLRTWRDINDTLVGDENLETNDRVIVLSPIVGTSERVLINDAGTFFATFNTASPFLVAAFRPPINSFETNLIYGIKPAGAPVVNPRMPFNRADYFISMNNVPDRCAPGTGVLIKSVINHGNGARGGGLPLLDCVADMQVVFGRDTDDDNTVDLYDDGSPGADAEAIRNELKEVRVYILAHEGQRDPSYTWTGPDDPIIKITDPDFGDLKDFDLNAVIGGTYADYRWKIYTIITKPYNLRS
jgi:prepilin-type N-terminal cleavage/methylation domain-containing protein